MSQYPECEKLSSNAETRNTVVAFLEWLSSQSQATQSQVFNVECADTFALSFLGIDRDKLEAERRAIAKEAAKSPIEKLADETAEMMKTRRVLNVAVGELAEFAQAMRARGFKAELTTGISLTTGAATEVVRITKKRARK